MGFIGNELFSADFEPMPDDVPVPELAGTKAAPEPVPARSETAEVTAALEPASA